MTTNRKVVLIYKQFKGVIMKPWKIVQLVGVLVLLLGVVIRVGGELFGMWLVILGVVSYTVGRIAAWLKSEQP